MNESGYEGKCDTEITTNLISKLHLWNNKDWLIGKEVNAIITGYNFDYGNPDNQNTYIEDHKIQLSVDKKEITSTSDTALNVNISTNFNGNNHDQKAYTITVYYSIVVTDPSYVSVKNITPTVEDYEYHTNSYWIDDSNFTSPIAYNSSLETTFVALSGYGFNFDNYSGLPFNRLTAYMSLTGTNTVRTKGAAYYKEPESANGGYINADTSRIPNAMVGLVFICKDTTVCKTNSDTFYDSVPATEDTGINYSESLSYKFTGIEFDDFTVTTTD